MMTVAQALGQEPRWRPDAKRVAENAAFLEGMAAVHPNPTMSARLTGCARDMRAFADMQSHFCGQGYVCRGGPTCTSDHK